MGKRASAGEAATAKYVEQDKTAAADYLAKLKAKQTAAPSTPAPATPAKPVSKVDVSTPAFKEVANTPGTAKTNKSKLGLQWDTKSHLAITW